ncbi:uncharacterized protein [Halyomorpha halys]|uniref:uncharacterized protein n=1 Tax=Halyomorpha halys TaxID=286706 RepID=UPI0006D4F285|nr:uncharacterized protein LOC106685888 [Halyomorpha halys]KAE8573787.1 EcKinase 34 [Halyomorpha halys]
MERVLTSVIPSLVKDGIFGNVEFEELKTKDDSNVGAQFASTLAFANLVLKNVFGEQQILPLVIKIPMPERSKEGRVQFMMESVMYKEILPTLGLEQVCYPTLHYSNVTFDNPTEHVMIFENVMYKHYRNSDSRTFLDFDHVSLALKSIAKYHSLSFILKHENMNKFLELTGKMSKCRYDYELSNIYDIPVHAAIERGIRGFEKINGSEEMFEELIRALQKPALVKDQLTTPDEPFDVICHGDFCNNNVMYKYNENGSPTDCILYDFQLSIYGNVAAELAFFLYMHTNSESRTRYWDSFMKIYWETLRKSVPDHIELPTYEDFLEYFGTRAVCGYAISACFLPMLMDPNVKYWGGLPVEEQVALMKNMAGDKGEKAIVDVVSHMYNNSYIHKFLDYMKKKNYLV